jgi:hypothetical protein
VLQCSGVIDAANEHRIRRQIEACCSWRDKESQRRRQQAGNLKRHIKARAKILAAYSDYVDRYGHEPSNNWLVKTARSDLRTIKAALAVVTSGRVDRGGRPAETAGRIASTLICAQANAPTSRTIL